MDRDFLALMYPLMYPLRIWILEDEKSVLICFKCSLHPESISMSRGAFGLTDGDLGLVLRLIGSDILVELPVLGCARKKPV